MFFQVEPDTCVEHKFVGFGVYIPSVDLQDAEELVVDCEGDDTVIGSCYFIVQITLVYFGLGTATAIVGNHCATCKRFADFGVDAFYLFVVDLIGVGTGEGFYVDGRTFGKYGLCRFAKGCEHGVYFVNVTR